MVIHVVKPGDSIFKISKQYGVSVEDIENANRFLNPDALAVGQAVIVPTNSSSYAIQRGQSLYTIAKKYGISLNELMAANPQIKNSERLQPGQMIMIPVAPKKSKEIFVNGYTYPSISPEILSRTLPYLSFLSIFSYNVKVDGSLRSINDSPQITAARGADVGPLMVITNIEEGSGFSSELAHVILTDMNVQDELVDNVIAILKERDYYGLDMDFEYIYPEDRQNYANFVSRMVDTLKPLGYSVSIALAPKLSANQKGLLYEAHDYAALGALVDHVILMTYEWGYTYSPAKAVAPIDQVRKVLDYATSVIPSEKILMGMPNYGYDWTLPFVKGTAAKSITNNKAISIALENNAQIEYDKVSQSPYYNYYDSEGKKHEVWFEDARSIQARLELVNIYNLGGVSYWTINSFFGPNWTILNSMFDIIKVM